MKTYREFIQEIFNYQGELVKNNDITKGKKNLEYWDINIDEDKYQITRRNKRGAYEIDFQKNYSYDKPEENAANSSKIFSVIRPLIKEKLDQGHAIRVEGARKELSGFYHRLLTKMNDREYGGRLHIYRDGDTTTIAHHPLPRRVEDIEDSLGLHHILDSCPEKEDLLYIIRNKGHVLDDQGITRILSINDSPDIASELLHRHLDKMGDSSIHLAYDNHASEDYPRLIDHILDNAIPEQIGEGVQRRIIGDGTSEQKHRMMDRVPLDDLSKIYIATLGEPGLCHRLIDQGVTSHYVLNPLSKNKDRGVVEHLIRTHMNELDYPHLDNIRRNFPDLEI